MSLYATSTELSARTAKAAGAARIGRESISHG